MNYQIIYQNLIEKRKQVIVEGYKEKHHIIPKCMGGTNERVNLVTLTAREHFIAHLLLVKIYHHKSLIYSANMMSYFKRYNSREYGWLKETHSNLMKGKPRSEETKRKISEAQKGKPKSEEFKQKLTGRKLSEETKNKQSDSRKGKPSGMKGKTVSEDHKNKISESNKGKVRSEEAKKNYSESKTGENNPNYGKRHSEETRKKMSDARQRQIKLKEQRK